MKQSIGFDSLNENVSRIFLEYMDLHDYLQFKLVSKTTYSLAEAFTYIWERECTRLFTSSLTLFMDKLGNNGGEKKKEMFQTACNKERYMIWRNLLEMGNSLKREWKFGDEKFGLSEEKVDWKVLGKYVLNSLRDPPLTPPSLTREDFNIYLRTPYQQNISQLIFSETQPTPTIFNNPHLDQIPDYEDFVFVEEDESKGVFGMPSMDSLDGNPMFMLGLGLGFEDTLTPQSSLRQRAEEIIATVEKYSQDLIGESFKNKAAEDIANSRWLTTSNLTQLQKCNTMSTTIAESQSQISNWSIENDYHWSNSKSGEIATPMLKTCLLLQLFELIQETFCFHCKVVMQLLNQQKNDVELLLEYSKRWSGYVASGEDLERLLSGYARTLNTAYETLFPGYPTFPRYSIFRHMVSTWRREIYEPMSHNLQLAFKNTLKALIKQQIRCSVPLRPANQFIPSMQETKEEIGTSSNSWMQKGEVRNKQDEIIFKHNIINNYANAMADLSVNDLNIHYIGHTKFIPEIPYELLHLSVISTTRRYLRKNVENLNVAQMTNKWDSIIKGMKETFLPKTCFEMESTLREQITKHIRSHLTSELEQFQPNWEKLNPIEEHNDQAKFQDSIYAAAQSTYIGKYLFNLIGTNIRGRKLVRDFYVYLTSQREEMCDLFNHLTSQMLSERIPEFDLECEYINKRRGIPMNPSETELLLYSNNKDIELSEIEELYEEHMKSKEKLEKNSKLDNEEVDMEMLESPELIQTLSTNSQINPMLEELDYDGLDDFLLEEGLDLVDDIIPDIASAITNTNNI